MDPEGWAAGLIDWTAPLAGAGNVVQVRASVPSGGYLYWWRQEQGGEDLATCCTQFACAFPFPAYPWGTVPCTADEWAPDGSALLQSQRFGFTPSDLTVFC